VKNNPVNRWDILGMVTPEDARKLLKTWEGFNLFVGTGDTLTHGHSGSSDDEVTGAEDFDLVMTRSELEKIAGLAEGGNYYPDGTPVAYGTFGDVQLGWDFGGGLAGNNAGPSLGQQFAQEAYALIPGAVAYDSMRANWASGNTGMAVANGVTWVGEQALFVFTVGQSVTAHVGIRAATTTVSAAESGAATLIDDAARTPVGRSGNPMSVPGPQNVRTVINGREYSGHALDQMQGRGFVPSVVEDTIQQGTTFPARAGTTGVYDAVNNVRVITDTATGRVVTVIPGPPSP